MLEEDLEEQAALYALGAMSEADRASFELVLEFHDEAKTLVRDLQEVVRAATFAAFHNDDPKPSAGLKDRIMDRVNEVPQEKRHGFVVAGRDGLVRWVNPEFTEMCGYTLDELRGNKLGPFLQGNLTDRDTAQMMRAAVHAFQPCVAELINYHKNGRPYWVRIQITPISDPQGEIRWLAARETELKDRLIASPV